MLSWPPLLRARTGFDSVAPRHADSGQQGDGAAIIICRRSQGARYDRRTRKCGSRQCRSGGEPSPWLPASEVREEVGYHDRIVGGGQAFDGGLTIWRRAGAQEQAHPFPDVGRLQQRGCGDEFGPGYLPAGIGLTVEQPTSQRVDAGCRIRRQWKAHGRAERGRANVIILVCQGSEYRVGLRGRKGGFLTFALIRVQWCLPSSPRGRSRHRAGDGRRQLGGMPVGRVRPQAVGGKVSHCDVPW